MAKGKVLVMGSNATRIEVQGGATSGRVLTGTNPASGRSATERGVKLFDNLELP